MKHTTLELSERLAIVLICVSLGLMLLATGLALWDLR